MGSRAVGAPIERREARPAATGARSAERTERRAAGIRGKARPAATRGFAPVLVLSGALAVPWGCGGLPSPGVEAGAEGAPAETLLREMNADVGIEETAGPWPDGSFFLPEIMGPGVGLFDYDGDGDLDLLQVRLPPPGRRSAAAPNRLFQQQADGTFRDVTEASGLGDPGIGQGVAIGDVDDDGDPDVYFTNYGPDAFYRNNGDGTFTEATAAAGFRGDRFSSSATFCDYDGDGDLDLYVAHDLRLDYIGPCRSPSGVDDSCGPQSFDGEADTLYRNDGDGTFTDVTDAAGIRPAEGGKRAKGLGVVCLDLTGDGRLDFYVANDGEANNLWVGQPDGSFADEALMRGVAVNLHGKPEASMGIAVGDVDQDGRLDLLTTHLSGEHNTLYMGAPGFFVDRTLEAGMAQDDLPRTGFGCGFFDLDHDGDLDLAVVNGDVLIESARAGRPFWQRYAEPNLLFLNDGTGRFANASSRAGKFASRVEVSRGLALGDLDRDGDLDLVVSNGDDSLRIYRNEAPPRGAHWLRVRTLVGRTDALGALVAVAAGGRRLVAPVLANFSYLSASEPRAHFGLGEAVAVDSVEVAWPDGSRERFAIPGVDREVTLIQGRGEHP